MFATLTRSGYVFAKLVDDVEARDLIPIIKKRVKKDSIVCSDTWRVYTGLATKGYVHRIVNNISCQYVDKRDKTNHING